jgi:hypothetical protein
MADDSGWEPVWYPDAGIRMKNNINLVDAKNNWRTIK